MIYCCYKCGSYGFYKVCECCQASDEVIPLKPEFLPEFEYRSSGLISDILFKKRDKEKIGNELDSILLKYYTYRNPYFINYIFYSIRRGDVDSNGDLALFKEVLLNLGFEELDKYSELLDKLVKCTYFNFVYDNFVRNIQHHIKYTLEDTLLSWVNEKGDVFRRDLPLLFQYIYDNDLFKESVLYSINIDPYAKNLDENRILGDHSQIYELCEKFFFTRKIKDFQFLLEGFDVTSYKSIYDVDEMTGFQFEDFIYDVYNKLGYEVRKTQKGADQGADLFVESFGRKKVIQIKNYTGNVGNKAVQEVISAKQFYDCDDAIVIANRYFTLSAKQLASKANVELIDRDGVKELLEEYNNSIIESSI